MCFLKLLKTFPGPKAIVLKFNLFQVVVKFFSPKTSSNVSCQLKIFLL